MGAETFFAEATGKTPREAFSKAVEEACYAHGHGGYTGTIGEKRNFIEIDLPEDIEPYEFANSLIDGNDDRVDDKWGPAGCLNISSTPHAFKGEKVIRRPENTYLFFGWASS